ncbi:MAG: hypothetical protein WCF19_01910 [Chlamydiales bacterium]
MAKLICFLLLFGPLSADILYQRPLSDAKFKELAQFGMELAFAPLPPTRLGAHLSPPRKEGILSPSDFNRTGNICKKWLQISPIKPNQRIRLEYKKREPDRPPVK